LRIERRTRSRRVPVDIDAGDVPILHARDEAGLRDRAAVPGEEKPLPLLNAAVARHNLLRNIGTVKQRQPSPGGQQENPLAVPPDADRLRRQFRHREELRGGVFLELHE
jgi:hypothetical protein